MGDAGGIKRNGLQVDRAKALDWQRRSAIRYAAKQRGRRQAARLTTRLGRATSSDWSPRTRRLAYARSGGICEVCLVETACHLHHRKLRRHGDHRVVNALHLCNGCHTKIHAAPSWSYVRGYLVKADRDPAVVPVHVDDARLLLTMTGTYREAA